LMMPKLGRPHCPGSMILVNNAVWEELARQGKLKRAGGGLYELGQP